VKTKQEIEECIEAFKERTGADPTIDGNGQSMTCPYCGTKECVINPKVPKEEQGELMKMLWCIKAFKVDNYSHCRVCDQWFGS
jgi:hypothetical protein